MTMDLYVRVPPCRPVPDLVRIAQDVEAAGFTGISFPDSQLLWRDVWATTTATALATERLELQVAVTNPVTRHPTVTASAARTVAEIAPGRFRVAIGAGDSALTFAGLQTARHRDLGRAVEAVCTLLDGAAYGVDGGQPWVLRDPVRVPVLVGASGPRNLALGGRFGDGALIPGVNWTRDVDLVRQAAIESGRDPTRLTMVMTRPCIITDDPQRDCVRVKPACLRLAQLGAAPIFAAAGFPIEVPPHDISSGDLGHPEDVSSAIEVASRWIPDDAALWFARTRCLFGTAEEVVGQMQALEAEGVGDLLVADLAAFEPPFELIERFGTDVLPLYSRL